MKPLLGCLLSMALTGAPGAWAAEWPAPAERAAGAAAREIRADAAGRATLPAGRLRGDEMRGEQRWEQRGEQNGKNRDENRGEVAPDRMRELQPDLKKGGIGAANLRPSGLSPAQVRQRAQLRGFLHQPDQSPPATPSPAPAFRRP
jgi:hypothetical protein